MGRKIVKAALFAASASLFTAAAGAQDVATDRARDLAPDALAGAGIVESQNNALAPAMDKSPVTYTFSDCQRPIEPVFDTENRSQTRMVRGAQNRAVNQYNEHVTASNDYMRCIAEEAQRDLDAYYMAVSAALEAEQGDVMTDLEVLRKELNTAR